jgi:hypothetical protein
MSGYSGTPLQRKLGIKDGDKITVLNYHGDYKSLFTPGELQQNEIFTDWPNHTVEFIHFFAKNKAELNHDFPRLKNFLMKTGSLWISWPKKSASVQTDLDENIVRDLGLEIGLVDVKVCAIDNIWSGLKFVWRTKDR